MDCGLRGPCHHGVNPGESIFLQYLIMTLLLKDFHMVNSVTYICFPLFHTFFKTNSLFSHQNYAKEKKQPKGNFDQLMVKIYNTYFQQSKKPFYDLPSLMYLFYLLYYLWHHVSNEKKCTHIDHFPFQEFWKIYII